jgi:hypothetical protein
LQILDPFNTLFDEGHTALALLSNAQAEQVMAKLGMSHDGAEDFDHPRIPESDPLRRQVLDRLTGNVWLFQRLRRCNATLIGRRLRGANACTI